ncbi:MAG: hypothetical protein H0W84_10840 [Bacteroidetes bacterium]|nr:hypothetical protein [Bacteroidota bacterium]
MKKKEYYSYLLCLCLGVAGYFIGEMPGGIMIGFSICILLFSTIGKKLERDASKRMDDAIQKIIQTKKFTDGDERA